MPQPKLPAPLAPRPDPGIQLLEAVRQRQAQRSLQLAQQWVHRRGVLDLQQFCATRLASTEGQDAVAWLHDLVALDTTIAAPAGTPAAPLSATLQSGERSDVWSEGEQGGPPPPTEELASGVATQPEARFAPANASEEVFAALPIGEAASLDDELQARAVAAVDEAFAALAETFQPENAPQVSPGTSAPAASVPVVRPAAVIVPEPHHAAPLPLPARSGLWPSLRASAASLSSALRPALASTATQAEAAAPMLILSEEGPTAPRPPEEPGGGLAAPAEPAVQAATPAEPADKPGGAGPTASDAMGETGLVRRLRGRIEMGRLPQLSRLQAVLRDCVEETMALLRAPEPETSDDGGDSVAGPVLEPSPPLLSEQSTPPWSLDPFQRPSSLATGSGSNPGASAAAPAEAAPAPRLHFSLPPSKPEAGGERPAPVPDSLSDLRAWLPDRGDLPRAS